MWRAALDSTCPLCKVGAFPRIPFPRHNKPWISQRTLHTRQRSQPSRMVLSDHVARPPASASARRPRQMEGPFAGMNRTVANIDPSKRRAKPTSESHDGRDKEKRSRKGRDFKALKM